MRRTSPVLPFAALSGAFPASSEIRSTSSMASEPVALIRWVLDHEVSGWRAADLRVRALTDWLESSNHDGYASKAANL